MVQPNLINNFLEEIDNSEHSQDIMAENFEELLVLIEKSVFMED